MAEMTLERMALDLAAGISAHERRLEDLKDDNRRLRGQLEDALDRAGDSADETRFLDLQGPRAEALGLVIHHLLYGTQVFNIDDLYRVAKDARIPIKGVFHE